MICFLILTLSSWWIAFYLNFKMELEEGRQENIEGGEEIS
jgi:hypothetical protein